MKVVDCLIVDTPRMRIVCPDFELLSLFLTDEKKFKKSLDINITEGWNTFGLDIFNISLDILKKDIESYGWGLFFFIHKDDNSLIGTGGYKGVPDNQGMVEIGYEIAEKYQNKGLATESALFLVKNAFKDYRVAFVQAHTDQRENASTHVLANCEFEYKESYIDKEEGSKVFRWEVLKPELRM